jgi:glycosyltransferase involved in cell wall biosynthesis
MEVIVVENGGSTDVGDWLAATYPAVKFSFLSRSRSFAGAVNHGVSLASGRYVLLLNPDVIVESDAVASLVEVAKRDPRCAAVAAKLRLSWAPAFLNGVGNRVESSSWGTDNAIGQLDLGQFDDWSEIPSACYAAALIPRAVWNRVGPADEGFPLYYEDSEWSYRARLLGYAVRLAPRAIIYHAFGSKAPTSPIDEDEGLTPRKLQCVVYGRLRFASKLLGPQYLRAFIRNYRREDWSNARAAFRQRDWPIVAAYARGWLRVAFNGPSLWRARRSVQRRRTRSDEELFKVQQTMPPSLLWRGLPELTWDTVQRHYLPLFESKRTRPVPEFE